MNSEKRYGGWVNPGENAEVKTPEQKDMETGAEQTGTSEPSLGDIIDKVAEKDSSVLGGEGALTEEQAKNLREAEEAAAKEVGFDK